MSKATEKEIVTDKMTEEKETSGKTQSAKKDTQKSTSAKTKKKSADKELERLKGEAAELKDKYLRLYSEFENYRRRTAKEKLDLVGTANEDLMIELLPVIDDFERAIKATENDKDNGKPLDDGILLIYNKLKNVTEKKGLKQMETGSGDEFNSEIHDAITQIPAPDEKLKGKIVDTIEKGYYLNDKVIRFAKVVIGA